jgi:hypothetical protein
MKKTKTIKKKEEEEEINFPSVPHQPNLELEMTTYLPTVLSEKVEVEVEVCGVW